MKIFWWSKKCKFFSFHEGLFFSGPGGLAGRGEEAQAGEGAGGVPASPARARNQAIPPCGSSRYMLAIYLTV